jgi:DNA-binding GntR family transcriptional regulator
MAAKKKSGFSAIEAVPLHEKVYQQIVQALMSGHFQPGQKLTSRGVAAELGTSDMPVRSAFKRLQALRALDSLPNGGVEVPSLTAHSFSNLMEARVIVEGAATELAATRLNGNNLRTVRHHCKERSLAAKAGDIERYLENNYNFKFAIYRHCGNEHLLFMIETLWLHAGPFLRKFVEGLEGSLSQILDVDHLEKALAAIEAKDAAAARDAIVLDIREAARHLLQHATFLAPPEDD